MKKILLPLFLLPMMFGVLGKNSVKTDSFALKTPSFSYVTRSAATEEFLIYWASFREANPEVCEISYAAFSEMYFGHYQLLFEEDKKTVNESRDVEEGYTIGQIIRTLVNMYYPNHNKVKEEKKKLDQSSIIIIATVVALVGATAISILYILKNNKVIE